MEPETKNSVQNLILFTCLADQKIHPDFTKYIVREYYKGGSTEKKVVRKRL